MEILEFDLPSSFMPIEPYWINDLGIVLISSNIDLPKSEYFCPNKSMKVLIFGENKSNARKLLGDLILFFNFLNQNHTLFNWFQDKSFTDILIYQKSVDNIKNYANEISFNSGWYQTIDFDKFPLIEMTSDPTKVSFKKLFTKYHNLTSLGQKENELKSLIDFFAYNTINHLVMGRIYNNSNLYVSNSFILLEYLIKQNVKEKYRIKKCPICKGNIKGLKKMDQLIKEYVKDLPTDKKIKEIFLAAFKQHYRIRNDFFHEAKYASSHDKILSMIKKLGRNSFSLMEEIKHAGGYESGLFMTNSFVRHELLNMLDEKYSST